jgi:histidine triad (HIT) family protein
MSSIFTKIINREIPAAIIYEDNHYIAFMDTFPQVKGHVLVCPKEEVDCIFDLNEEVYTGLFLLVKKLAPALKDVMTAKRICLQVEG